MRSGRNEDVAAVRTIRAECFGGDSAGDITGLLARDTGTVLVAECAGQVVGFAQAWFTSEAEVLADTVAILPAWQRRGVGSALLRGVKTWCVEQGGSSWWAEAWVRCDDGSIPAATLLAQVGMVPVRVEPSRWADDSAAKGYVCVACGGPPCRCAALIFAGAIPAEQ